MKKRNLDGLIDRRKLLDKLFPLGLPNHMVGGDYTLSAHAVLRVISEMEGFETDRLRELAMADRERRCVVLNGQNDSLSAIRELYGLLCSVENSIKNKDFSIFRHVGAGVPTITIPFCTKLHWIEDRYDEVICTVCKEAEAALEAQKGDAE